MIRGAYNFVFVKTDMTYVPITPFRRTVDAACLAHQKYATADLPPQGVNKYEVIRELTVARKRIGVTDREISVLQALLSFHPATVLGGNTTDLLVYPSNASIQERLHGMACSTMRRHLAGLVKSGLILRRDSPNGKRYVKRFGGDAQAFGFDLTPLVARYAEICDAAEAQRTEDDAQQRLRRTVSLMKRDLAGLVQYGMEARPDVRLWPALADLAAEATRALRRIADAADLAELEARLSDALDAARDVFDLSFAENTSTKEHQIEQHHQNSNKDLNDFEPCLEKAKENLVEAGAGRDLPNIPITLVVAVCAELKVYYPDKVRHWHQIVRAAETVRPMMGISMSAWSDAVAAMGAEEAAVVVLAMLERFSEIQSPGGYLRTLTRKAEEGAFSCGPMVMALMRREAA